MLIESAAARDCEVEFVEAYPGAGESHSLAPYRRLTSCALQLAHQRPIAPLSPSSPWPELPFSLAHAAPSALPLCPPWARPRWSWAPPPCPRPPPPALGSQLRAYRLLDETRGHESTQASQLHSRRQTSQMLLPWTRGPWPSTRAPPWTKELPWRRALQLGMLAWGAFSTSLRSDVISLGRFEGEGVAQDTCTSCQGERYRRYELSECSGWLACQPCLGAVILVPPLAT